MKRILVIYTWPPLDPKFIHYANVFAKSYKDHSAGIEHDVLIAIKDDKKSTFPFPAKAEWMAVGNYGYDIGPFLRISREVQGKYDAVILLGAYARILINDWLKKLSDGLDNFHLVSATGSFESGITANNPNPSLRTTAFGISPALLTQLWPTTEQNQSTIMLSKHECYEFEHGNQSIYRRAVQAGYRGAVVGNDKAYPENEWNLSNTFRKQDQRNLIVADNNTDLWMNSDSNVRNYLTARAGFTA